MKQNFCIEFKNEGQTIKSSKSAEAFIKALEHIGLNRIANDNIVTHCGYNVVSMIEREPINGCKAQVKVGPYYIWTHLNNNDKTKDLLNIALFYGIDMAVYYEAQNGEEEPKKEEPKKEEPKKEEPKEEPKKEEPKEEPKKEEPKKEEPKKEVIRSSEYDYVKAQVMDNIPVYLYGPAGTGKTQMAMDLANDLGLEFYCTSSVLESVQLSGYCDGYGIFHDTEFFKAFTQGGLFLFDEIDISNPIEVKAFNMAISQKVYVFNGKQYKAHPNFRVIAAGNTLGTGSNESYEGNELDPSVRDRFEAIYYGYDERIELLITKNDKELVSFTHAVRDAVKEAGMNFVVSYRALVKFMQKRGQLDRNIITLPKAINQSFFSFLDNDNKMIIANNIACNNKYAKALKEAVNM